MDNKKEMSQKEMTTAELELLSAGQTCGHDNATYMVCQGTGCNTYGHMKGIEHVGKVYDCPKCGRHTYKGINPCHIDWK